MSDEMLEITIKLIPFGDYSNDKDLSLIRIINDGTGTREKANYIVKYTENPADIGIHTNIVVKIKNYERDQGYLKLVNKAIKKILSNKDKECIRR